MSCITPNDMLYVSAVLYGVGFSFGVTLCALIAFHNVMGSKVAFTSFKDHISAKMVYVMGLVNIMYFQVKVPQLNGINNDCGTQEMLSVLFYLGSNLILYLFYVFRYIEVYGWRQNTLIPVLFFILIFAVAIPVSILSNVTGIKDGTCFVNHPPISSYFPSITCFIISAYMMVLFLYPLFQFSNFSSDSGYKKKRLAINIFATNLIALVSTVLFNVSLSTPFGKYAPLTSSLDLVINFVMVCLPYFMAKSSSTNSKQNKDMKDSQMPSNVKSISEKMSKM